MYIERELKLELPAAALERLLRLAPSRRSLASVYFDTPERALLRAGASLRLRRDGRKWLQTLKTDTEPQAGLATRAEWEMPVARNALALEAFPGAEIKAATGLDLARLRRRLRPVFETRFVRRTGLVALGDGASAELALDRGAILAGRRREPISEVELELKGGAPPALLQFATELALPLAFESKAERGYRLAAGGAPAPRKWRAPQLSQIPSAHEAFAAVFSAALAQAGANARGVRESEDPEFLHQMRVGLRRMRSALRAFAKVIDKPKALLRSLKRLSPALGEARDWDVFVENLRTLTREQALLKRAQANRVLARQAARAVVSSPEFNLFLLRALRWIHSAPDKKKPKALAAYAETALSRLHRKTAQGADWRDAERRHRLRIRVKRLRYACEFFAPCFRGVEPYLSRLQALQQILGQLNDIAVARKLLKELGGSPSVAAKLDARERRLIARLERGWNAFAAQRPFWKKKR